MYRPVLSAPFFVWLLLGLSSLEANGVDFTDCGSSLGKFSSVTVSGCDKSKQKCDLVRGTNATINIQFTTDEEIEKVTAVVHAVYMDMTIHFPMKNADACASSTSGITCPLKKGGSYDYHATLLVERYYPKLSLTVKWELQNEKKEDIICVYIPARIK